MKKSFVIAVTVFILPFTMGLSNRAGADEILGCYGKARGQLRIVNDHSECSKSELPIYLKGSLQPEPPIQLPEGEYCWEMDYEEVARVELHLGVFHHGNGHYLVSGTLRVIWLNADTEDIDEFAIHGNAEVFSDNRIHMSLSHGYASSNGTGGDIWNFVLDENFDGVANGVNVWVSFDETDVQVEHDGPILFLFAGQCESDLGN